jgi:hypothetical protein
MAVDIVTRAVDTKVCMSRAIIKNVAWCSYEISDRSNPSEVANLFPRASHTMKIAQYARLATGVSIMNYTRTENDKEIKKQEIKNFKTICISKNGECH